MSDGAILVTGATGFIGLQLIRLLLRGSRPIYVLARGNARGTAAIQKLAQAKALRALWGDITQPSFGLPADELASLSSEVTCVIHTAGAYHLSLSRDEAYACNVAGLRNLLKQAQSWPLAEFHHVSSIVAAGERGDDVLEAALSRPQRFRNPYEESKWMAESTLLDWDRVPTRFYRLGIVIGDSRTGVTQKFDGPYPAFTVMRRHVPFVIPRSGDTPFPLVTVDLAVEALASGVEDPPRKLEFLHVVDTEPPSVREFAEAMMMRIAGHKTIVSIPRHAFLKLSRIPAFVKLFGVESAACAYMCSRTTYSVSKFVEFCRRMRIRSDRVKDAYDALASYYAVAHGRVFRPQDRFIDVCQ